MILRGFFGNQTKFPMPGSQGWRLQHSDTVVAILDGTKLEQGFARCYMWITGDRRAGRIGKRIGSVSRQPRRWFLGVESGNGGKREQGDPGRKSRQGSGDPADPGRAPDRGSERGDLRKLA